MAPDPDRDFRIVTPITPVNSTQASVSHRPSVPPSVTKSAISTKGQARIARMIHIDILHPSDLPSSC